MRDSRLRSWRSFGILAAVAILLALGGLAVWMKRDPRDLPQSASLAHAVPATYQTVTTTVDAMRSGDTASKLTWNWQYDTEGRLQEVLGPGGVATRITYAPRAAEPAGVAEGTTRRVLAWDAQGRLLSAEGSGGNVSFTYSRTGWPAEVRSEGAPSLSYRRDAQGRLSEMRIGAETSIQYRYDYLGRPTSIATSVGEITYSYPTPTNTVVRTLPNGLQTLRELDDEGKLISLTHVGAHRHVIAAYTYAYRPDGLIEGITEQNQKTGARTCSYQYDLMHRLTAAECRGNGRSHHYRYDSMGNLVESLADGGEALRFANTTAGALLTDSRGPSRTDDRGHIRRLAAADKAFEYDFNSAGELAAVNGQDVLYTHNALGSLTSRVAHGRKTQYLPDPFAAAWRPLWQRDADGAETVTVWDGAVPLIELQGKDARYRLEDHLGSVRVEVDSDGRILASHDYTPYGAPESAAVGTDLRPGFASLFWDPAAGVYQAMSRAYDPVTARFLQPDPQVRVPDHSAHSHSLYAYSGGDPVNFVDRNGGQAEEAVRLDADRRWRDSMWRSLVYDLFGSLRLWIPPELQSPLALHTDPEVRDSMVRSLIADAWKLSGRDIETAHRFMKSWRERRNDRPPSYLAPPVRYMGEPVRYVAPLPARYKKGVATGEEFRAAENYLYGREMAETRKTLIGTLPEWIPLAPVLRLGVFYWNRSHDVGEAVGLRHGVFLAPLRLLGAAISGSPPSPRAPLNVGEPPGRGWWGGGQEWLPDSPAARNWRVRGIDDGLGAIAARKTMSQRPPRSLWQRIDDFLVRPAYGDEIATSAQPASPSPVGGVYLGGAGKALEHFGNLTGIAVDDTTGKLVLVGSDDRHIPLPPLRVDDIVTVFRAVYDHGESPSVTIDPDERDPTGPSMVVKHGPGTAGTYVGWILFQCDRIMKSYQLGHDNATRAALTSRVAGHAKTIEAVYFGDPDRQGVRDTGWERFWIVPAAVNRFDSAPIDLSLFELPLAVNTQRMRWERGKLVGDERPSSFGANAFKAWFSEHYDEIADEVLLAPPAGAGFHEPVAIFHELRRIAVIAAAAERLRELGQTMPAWMRDYQVAPFQVPSTTPALTVKRSKDGGRSIDIATIYGGVNLAPADADVHSYSDRADAPASVPGAHLSFVSWARQAAVSLASKVPQMARAGNPIGTVGKVATPDGRSLLVAVLPGGHSRALAPNRQSVTDMAVFTGRGRYIGLTRYYNSFFDPSGEYGRGWTLDLPHLLRTPVPTRRDGNQTHHRLVPHLVSPLGSVDVRFDDNERVEGYGVEMSVSKEHPEVVGVARGREEITGSESQQVLFRNGSVWHFDDGGRLVLVQEGGGATRYVRGSGGHVIQVVGYVGTEAVAEIRVGYDDHGRIVHLAAKQMELLHNQEPPSISELAFDYDANGRLLAVKRPPTAGNGVPAIQSAYTYEADRLTKISNSDGIDLSYGYNGRGELLWEQEGDTRMDYSVATAPQGTTLTRTTGEGTQSERWTYDARWRPLEALGNGQAFRWRYGNGSEVWETFVRGGKTIFTRSTTSDGGTETTAFTNGPTYEVHRDASGHRMSLSIDGVATAEISSQPNGEVGSLRAGDTEVHLRRREDGLATGVLISSPKVVGKNTQWLEEEWDVMGRPIKITDSSGFEFRLSYDEGGRLSGFGRLTEDGKLLGANLVYDRDGLVTRIDSSWGTEKREYTSDGVLAGLEAERLGAKSATSFDQHGRILSHLAFDGGRTAWRYADAGPGAKLRMIELPGGERIDYAWGDPEQKRSAEVTMGTANVDTLFDAAGRVVSISWGDR